MPSCDMCGSESVGKAIVEGSPMDVCQACSKFGKMIKTPRPARIPAKPDFSYKAPGAEETIVDNYSQKIRNAREKLGLKQKEFALKIAEKESVVHKLESGNITPSINLAKKLEKILNIKLTEKEESLNINSSGSGVAGVTIGDMIKIKKRN